MGERRGMSEKNCVLTCVTAQKNCARLIHQGAALAKELGAPLRVLHVCSGNKPTQPENAEILNELFSLAHDYQAEMDILYEPDAPAAIARYAQACGALLLVMGPDRSGTATQMKKLLPLDYPVRLYE